MLWNRAPTGIWKKWNAEGRPEHVRGDQGAIERYRPRAQRLQTVFPGKFCSFKADDCDDGAPDAAAVMCFHGVPKPHELPSGHWSRRIWEGEKVAGWAVS